MLALTLSDRTFAGSTLLAEKWQFRCTRLDALDALADAPRILSASEQARFAAMRDREAADLRRVAHVQKRRAVAARLSLAPESVVIGAPDAPLADGSFVSISHTTGAVAVALCDDMVGVDIEPVRDRGDHQRLASRFFSTEEAALIRALQPAEAAFAFAWRWTAKEALLKAKGMRLGDALATAMPDEIPPFAAAVAGARIYVFAPAPGLVCTVARAG